MNHNDLIAYRSRVEKKAPANRQGWAWSNYGILLGVERTRKDAIAAVERHTGYRWSACRKYMEVWPCEVKAKT